MTATLKYSPLISVPILGYGLLSAQLVLIFFHLSTTFYLSDREKYLIKPFIQALEKNFDHFNCQSWQIGHVLTFFTKPIHLDLPKIDADLTQKTQYRNLLWTLGSASKMSARTLKQVIIILQLQ